MYIVNTTFIVSPVHHEQWLKLVREDYIPLLEDSGFGGAVLSRVLSQQAEEHFTYSLMVDVASVPDYHLITGPLFDRYRAMAEPLLGEPPVWFTTLLKKV